MEIVNTNNEARDEVFLQIIKQLTDNIRIDSIKRGWELLSILLYFFLPFSPETHETLLKFVESNSDSLLDSPEVCVSQYAKHCMKRLQKQFLPALRLNVETVQQAKFHIFHPSMFGTSLEELMEMQATRFPDLKIPWVQSVLIRLIFEKGGDKTEGIFYVRFFKNYEHS